MGSDPSGINLSNIRSRSSAGVSPEGIWWKVGCGALMALVICGAFLYARGAVDFVGAGDVARIVFFHVPVAVQCQVWYFVASFYSVRVLVSPQGDRNRLKTDAKAATAMELGLLASILATITGSVFAHLEWNSYWNWDPREMSIVGLMLVYASYTVLRGAVQGDTNKRAQLCAVYAIVTVIPATFLIWVVPRIPALQSLHPQNVLFSAKNTSGSYRLVLYGAFIPFTALFIWLFQLRYRVLQLAARRLLRRGQ